MCSKMTYSSNMLVQKVKNKINYKVHIQSYQMTTVLCQIKNNTKISMVRLFSSNKLTLSFLTRILKTWNVLKFTVINVIFKGIVNDYTTSFFDSNWKILRKKCYFQNFSPFQFFVYKLCMIMGISIAP